MSTPPASLSGPGYRIPSLGYRILVSAVGLVPTILFLVGLPAGALAYAADQGINFPISVATVTIFGFAIAFLGCARYILKPTRLFGPLSIAVATVGILYLYVLLAASPYNFSIPGTPASLGIGFVDLLLLLMIVPGFTLAAGVVTTVEDVLHPTERLPFDFPA